MSTAEMLTTKDEIQRTAHNIWLKLGRRGTIAAGTGFGKSRVAIMEVIRLLSDMSWVRPPRILLVTPTTVMRDQVWPNEFKKWDADQYLENVKLICFASLKNEKGNKYDYVILDEIHRLTQLSASAFEADEEDEDVLQQFMMENLTAAVMGLTATVPNAELEPEKLRIINQVAPVVFSYTLDQAVSDGMVADYEIRVIQVPLDDTNKNVTGGTKAKPFLTTEEKGYNWLEGQIKRYRGLANNKTISVKDQAKFKNLVIIYERKRNQFLYNLPGKTSTAKRCLKHIGKGLRTLVFCGSISQANELGGKNVYHSKSGKAAFDAFNNKEIDLLCVVNAANEGINFVDLDQIIVLQVDSNERNLVQRVGRCLRARPDHKATIFILCVPDTADWRWLNKSIVNFDQNKIKHFHAKAIPE